MQSFSDPYGILSVMSTRLSVIPADDESEAFESTLSILPTLRPWSTALNDGCLQTKHRLPDVYLP